MSIFGLPGNPVSTFVTFLVFVRRVLADDGGRRTMLSLCLGQRPSYHEVTGDEARPHYFRGELTGWAI